MNKIRIFKIRRFRFWFTTGLRSKSDLITPNNELINIPNHVLNDMNDLFSENNHPKKISFSTKNVNFNISQSTIDSLIREINTVLKNE